MRRILATTFALTATACSGSNLDEYEALATSSLVLAQPDSVAPDECRQVGVIVIPEREISRGSRLSGAHLEAFFSALDAQATSFEANYVIPTASPDVTTAASTGAEFHASLFRCPG